MVWRAVVLRGHQISDLGCISECACQGNCVPGDSGKYKEEHESEKMKVS